MVNPIKIHQQKYCQLFFVLNYYHSTHIMIILKFCTEHGSMIAMLCAKFKNVLWHKTKVMAKPDFAWLQTDLLYCHGHRTHIHASIWSVSLKLVYKSWQHLTENIATEETAYWRSQEWCRQILHPKSPTPLKNKYDSIRDIIDKFFKFNGYVNGYLQDCRISIANTLEILQSWIKPLVQCFCNLIRLKISWQRKMSMAL